MATLQLGDKQITLRLGDMSVGSGAGMDILVPGAANAAPFAVVTTKGDGSVAVRRGFEGAPVKVNAIMLGVEPTPMIHGDKLEVAGVVLGFSDEKKSGSTQFLSGADLAELAKLRQQVAAGGKGGAPTASTGGRLVSLTDGREYAIPAKGLTLGREASCDVVISSGEVSRNHAEIAAGPDGYYVIDTSTNGVWVSGRRVEGTQTLGRSDVLKMGNEEFRFYADKAAAVASAGAGAATVPGTAVPSPSPAAPSPAPAPAPPPSARAAQPVAPPTPSPAPSSAPAQKPAAPTPSTPRPTVAKAPSPAKSGRPSVMFWILVAVLAVGGAAAYFLLFN